MISRVFEHYPEHRRGRCFAPFLKLQQFHDFWQIRAPYAPPKGSNPNSLFLLNDTPFLEGRSTQKMRHSFNEVTA